MRYQPRSSGAFWHVLGGLVCLALLGVAVWLVVLLREPAPVRPPHEAVVANELPPPPKAAESARFESPVAAETAPAPEPPKPVRVHGPVWDHLSDGLRRPGSRRIVFQAGRLNGFPGPEQAEALTDEFECVTPSENVTHVRDGGPWLGAARSEAECSGRAPSRDPRSETDPRDSAAVPEVPHHCGGQAAAPSGFPQRLAPGQAVVVHIESVPREDLLVRARVLAMTQRAVGPVGSGSLRIEANARTLWWHAVRAEGTVLTASFPAAYIEEGETTLVLTNTGLPACLFDALWIETAVAAPSPELSLGVQDIEDVPAAYQGLFGAAAAGAAALPVNVADPGLVREELADDFVKGLSQSAPFEFAPVCVRAFHGHAGARWESRAKDSLLLLELAIGFTASGGHTLVLDRLTAAGGLFSPWDGKPFPAWYPFREFLRLFAGERRAMPCNVVSLTDDGRGPPELLWFGMRNSPDVCSFAILGNPRIRREERVRLVAPVPWQGRTLLRGLAGIPGWLDERGAQRTEIATGAAPEQADAAGPGCARRFSDTLTVVPNGNGGLLEYECVLDGFLLLRVSREGTEPAPVAPPPEATPCAAMYENAAGGCEVRTDREATTRELRMLSALPVSVCSLHPSHRVRHGPATPGRVGTAEQVAPWNSQSVFVDIDRPDPGLPDLAAGIVVPMQPPRNRDKVQMSLWVRPAVEFAAAPEPARLGGRGRTAAAPDDVALGFAFAGQRSKVRLRNGTWQRLVWRVPRPKPPTWTVNVNGKAMSVTEKMLDRLRQSKDTRELCLYLDIRRKLDILARNPETCAPVIPDRDADTSYVVLAVNPTWSEYARASAIRFELNALTSVADDGPVRSVRAEAGENSVRLVMLAEPGSPVTFRHGFDVPVSIRRVRIQGAAVAPFSEEMLDGPDPKKVACFRYDSASQVLSVENVTVPQAAADTARFARYLNRDEAAKCAETGLVPLVADIEFER